MKTYVIVTNDALELPVSDEIVGAEEVAKKLGIKLQRLHYCLCMGFPKKAKYKAVVVADRQYDAADAKERQRFRCKMYAMKHDRREYYRQYNRRRGRVKCQTDKCLQTGS